MKHVKSLYKVNYMFWFIQQYNMHHTVYWRFLKISSVPEEHMVLFWENYQKHIKGTNECKQSLICMYVDKNIVNTLGIVFN